MTADSIFKATLVWLAALGIPLTGLTCVTGCAQNSEQPVKQTTGQVTPTKTEVAQPTQGNAYNIWIYNRPGGNTQKPETPTTFSLDSKGNILEAKQAKVCTTQRSGDNAQSDTTDATYAQTVVLNIGTGNQTPTASGSTTGTGGAQSPQQNPSMSSTQHPEAALSAPVGVAMPGGSNTQQANAAQGGGTATGDQTATTTQTTQLNKLAAQQNQMLDMLGQLWGAMFPGKPFPNTQPATP